MLSPSTWPVILSLSKETGQLRTGLSKILFSFSALLLLGTASAAFAWQIDSFDADLSVQPDSSLLVEETLHVDFQGEQRHGIYRDIPLQTEDRYGIRRSISLRFLGAVDAEDREWESHLTRQGLYQRIRLGSEARIYSGKKTFRIRYRVEQALGHFPEHDELYWNATGNNWAVPILQARATVHIPGAVPADQLKTAAYVGVHGSRSQEVDITLLGGNAAQYVCPRRLNPFEGLTIIAGWPKGIVRPPGLGKRGWLFLMDNLYILFPLLTLGFMWTMWRRFGRDPKPEAIVVQYDPPNGLTPAEVGALVDEQVDMKDITASIVDLARRGYLSIEEIEGEYLFKKTDRTALKNQEELKEHEMLLLKGLFPAGDQTRLSDLENKFYEDLPHIRTAVYKQLGKERYWRGRPDLVKSAWYFRAFLVLFFGLALASVFQARLSLGPSVFSVVVSAGIVAGFGRYMPRKTQTGVRALEQVLGLQEFLQRTDADRLRREKDPRALFERLLPFAMALGVANQWAKAFEGIYREPPTWYAGHGGAYFSPYRFTQRLDTTANRMGAVLTSAPRSSGGSGFSGGFSGGGGGGGGGGAW